MPIILNSAITWAGKLGVCVPLVPGIVPILSATQITRFTQHYGAKIPPSLLSRQEELDSDDATTVEFGVECVTRQYEELLRAGFQVCTLTP